MKARGNSRLQRVLWEGSGPPDCRGSAGTSCRVWNRASSCSRSRSAEAGGVIYPITIPLIAVVDDDESVRESVPDLLREFGFSAKAYPSAEAFLSCPDQSRISCLLLDIAMPGMSGPELLRELRRRGRHIPTVFITAHGDETTRPRLIQDGAVECLLKPFSEAALLAAIKIALKVA